MELFIKQFNQKSRTRALRGFSLAPVIFLLLPVFIAASGATNAAKASDIDHTLRFCDKSGCYKPDELGGWGVRPLRSYRLVYNGDAVCPVIQKTLNDTIKLGKAAEKRVVRTEPRWLRPQTAAELKVPDPTYHSQSPLFSDPQFLQWTLLEGVDQWTSGDPILTPGMQIYEKWQIVPFKNDGHPYLLTEASLSDGYHAYIDPPTVIHVWNVQPNELQGKDWSDYRTYQTYRTDDTHDPFAPFRASFRVTFSADMPDKELNFPKLPVDAQSVTKVGRIYHIGAWALFNRRYSIVQFIHINDRYYTILVDGGGRDEIVVLDAARPPGDDLCYLDSTISGKVQGP